VKEIPQLVDLQNEFGKDGFKVLAIAMEYDELPLIKTMRDQKGMNYEITWDQGGVLAKAFGGVRVTPTNFLVSGDGKIVMQQLGDFKVDDMRARIKTLL
jgi:peroxiredoxin